MTEINDKEPLDYNPEREIGTGFNHLPNQNPDLSPIVVLAIAFGMFILGNIVGSGLMIAMAKMEGLDFQAVLKSLNEDSPIGTRNFMRAVMLINHLFSFIIPASLTAWIAYKNNIFKALRLQKLPKPSLIGLGFLMLMFSMPLVQYAYQVNKMIPLPQWMIDMENSTGNILEAIIAKENFYEIIVNVLLIAVIPAIGEEMMFRGIIQQQFGRLLKNEHITVWISAAFFSAIHMQFQGFLARMILGALLGYLLIWTRSLWVPMIVHFLNNGLQVLMIYAMNIKPSDMQKIEEGDKMHWTLGLASLMLVIMIGKYIRDHHYVAQETVQNE